MQSFEKTEIIFDAQKRESIINHLINKAKIPFEEAEKIVDEEFFANQNVWCNDVYQVIIRETQTPPDFPSMLWLSIKRLDKEPIHDWRDLQTIKNMLIGEENEAVELYPAESRLVDSANQYHLWVLKDATIRFPFGFNDRVVSDELFNGGVNSKIAHRIKIDFAVECLQDILFETERFISNDAEEMILKKITELKNKRDGK